jgi:hypothetical protein
MFGYRGKIVTFVIVFGLVGSMASTSLAAPSAFVKGSCRQIHVVLRNDSWTRLAARFNVPLPRLLRLNRATTSTPLFRGNRVCLAPKAAASVVTTTTPIVPAVSTTTTTANPIAPVVTVAAMERCQPVSLSWTGSSPDTGIYALQWIRVSSSGVQDFSRYSMLRITGTSATLPNLLNGGATYAIRVFGMQPDWDGYAHTNQNVTPHSDVVTITVPECVPPVAVVRQWVQRGATQVGEATDDHYGWGLALSSDGSVMAVGAPDNDANGSGSGEVKVFTWSGTSWVQLGADIPGEAAGDWSGRDISLSSDGSVLAIGASFNDDGAANSGHVRVYAWSGSAWVQRGSDIDGQAAGDRGGLGMTMSADGSVVAIGAFLADGPGTDRGSVRIFAWNGSAWVQRGSEIFGQGDSDWFGFDVSLSSDGSVLAVGASERLVSGSDRGAVQVYAWNGSAWVQRGSEFALGYEVSLSSDGSILAIGAPFKDANGTDSGTVQVFVWSGSAWVQRGSEITGEAANDWAGYGMSLSADGSVVAVGSPAADTNGTNSGIVRVFSWDGSVWVQRGVDLDGDASGVYFGRTLSLAPDGSHLVGASLEGTHTAGRVRVFVWE